MHFLHTIMLAVTLALIAACDSTPTDAAASMGLANPAALERGLAVYRSNCADCHGPNAEGAPDWRQPGPDGKYPPPPLNGTGHAWHHPRAMLAYVIKRGSPGGGNMPAWEGKLSDEEIEAVITWFQSQWPDEVFRAWTEIDRRSRDPRS